MPSLEPQGQKLASLRRALGLTQLDLALRAGVSERTIRNAERGRPIDHAFLGFIAGALGVTVAEVTQPSGALDEQMRWQRNVDVMMTGLGVMLAEHDSSLILDASRRDVLLQMRGKIAGFTAADFMMGDYRGESGLKRFVDNGQQYWESCARENAGYYVEAPTGGGNLVVVRGGQQVPLDNGSLVWSQWVYICEFDGERLARVDEYLTPGNGMPSSHCLIESPPAEPSF